MCIIMNEIICLTLSRNAALQAKLAKCSFYEQFLMKVLDQLPEDYLEANDAMLMGIMMRFRTLSATNQSLVQMLVDTSDQVEAEQQKLQVINQEHTRRCINFLRNGLPLPSCQ